MMPRFLIALLLSFVSGMALGEPALSFNHACDQGPKLTIAAVGDVLLHRPLHHQGSKKGFMSLWQQAIPVIQSADIAYANLEGPVAMGYHRSTASYSSYPRFNYSTDVIEALKSSGFSVVSTANNHSLDRGRIGVNATIHHLQAAGMAFTGTRSERKSHWYTVVKRNGFKVAWLACTATTNVAMPKEHYLLYCYRGQDKKIILNTIQDLKGKVDAVIVAPHWGEQYQHEPNRRQTAWAKQILDAGAIAVIGAHPHVLQPLQRYVTQDGRETLIAYSLGNFVSNQGSLHNRSTIILLLTLKKIAGGKTVIAKVRYVPAYMQNRSRATRHLQLMTAKDKNMAAYRLIRRLLPSGNDINNASMSRC